jgi:hypothetical protein
MRYPPIIDPQYDRDDQFTVAIPMEAWFIVKGVDRAQAEAICQMLQTEIYDILDGRDFVAMLRAAACEDFPAPTVPVSVDSSGLEVLHDEPYRVTPINHGKPVPS